MLFKQKNPALGIIPQRIINQNLLNNQIPQNLLNNQINSQINQNNTQTPKTTSQINPNNNQNPQNNNFVTQPQLLNYFFNKQYYK
jgi:hypothetical protein